MQIAIFTCRKKGNFGAHSQVDRELQASLERPPMGAGERAYDQRLCREPQVAGVQTVREGCGRHSPFPATVLGAVSGSSRWSINCIGLSLAVPARHEYRGLDSPGLGPAARIWDPQILPPPAPFSEPTGWMGGG